MGRTPLCTTRRPVAEIELTPAQIAATHSVTKPTVLAWIRDDRLFPRYRVLPNGELRVPLSAYQAFLQHTEVAQMQRGRAVS